MPDNVFANSKSNHGFSVKLWRGERMALIGMDVEEPEPDFVGFAIEVCNPRSSEFIPLRNRLAFSYAEPTHEAVDGSRNFLSTDAPFQKFRWIHFPYNPKGGIYRYRVTKMHMPRDNRLVKGTSITLDISLSPVIYDKFLDLGFTRNYASSQAYADRFGNDADIIPVKANAGLAFRKVPGDVYKWLGFEAYELIFDTLKEVVDDRDLELDLFAYDLNEPDIVALLEKMGKRLRAVIDNSKDHKPPSSAESKAATRLRKSAGAKNVTRMHFSKLQHNKVLIVKRKGTPIKVLFGSTNFSFRGLYIQANNALLFYEPRIADLFEQAFQMALDNDTKFTAEPLFRNWHQVDIEGKPRTSFCFSPHADPALSMNPVEAAIDQATSSVFFAIAFLYQIKSGSTRDAIDRLMKRDIFSYGISDSRGQLDIKKPDGSLGIVNFAFLRAHTPKPFKQEWSGGKGIHEHDKFVVTDFNLPSAKVFTGSSNLSNSGEKGNGDNLVMIEDTRIATSYAIEALRIFDHLHFRNTMQRGLASHRAATQLTLQKPARLSGSPAWFADFYEDGGQKTKDRELFSH